MLQFIVSSFLVLIASLFQTTSLFLIGGVKPNLALVFIVAISNFEKSWIRRVILVLLAALILTFAPFATWIDIIFISAILFAVALLDYLPWQRIVNGVVVVSVLQRRMSLGELLDTESFTEVVRGFVELYRVGIKVFDEKGVVSAATIILNLPGLNFGIIALELIMNIILVSVFTLLLGIFYGTKKAQKKNRF